MRRHLHFAETNTFAQHQRTHQGSDTRVDVYHRAAREIKRSLLEDETCMTIGEITGLGAGVGIRTIPIPNHVRNRQVCKSEPENTEDNHRPKLETFCKTAG